MDVNDSRIFDLHTFVIPGHHHSVKRDLVFSDFWQSYLEKTKSRSNNLISSHCITYDIKTYKCKNRKKCFLRLSTRLELLNKHTNKSQEICCGCGLCSLTRFSCLYATDCYLHFSTMTSKTSFTKPWLMPVWKISKNFRTASMQWSLAWEADWR